ncbi:MAG: hypothetical protein PHO90_01240 [Candidatus Pacebacteria bacterium]|nr:hypothetical protein [Candidatus Paceibacterota bacterium]
MITKDDLFAGKPEPLGGLSNERDLVEICPDDFKSMANPWTDYAADLFYNGGSIKDWKWKTLDAEKQKQQLRCLSGILGGCDLGHEEKLALAGWMLSEMISEIPDRGWM